MLHWEESLTFALKASVSSVPVEPIVTTIMPFFFFFLQSMIGYSHHYCSYKHHFTSHDFKTLTLSWDTQSLTSQYVGSSRCTVMERHLQSPDECWVANTSVHITFRREKNKYKIVNERSHRWEVGWWFSFFFFFQPQRLKFDPGCISFDKDNKHKSNNNNRSEGMKLNLIVLN